jgi:hypothetical protein
MKEWMDENVVSSNIDENFPNFAQGPGLWKENLKRHLGTLFRRSFLAR